MRIIVVGAGIGGLSAAIGLRRAGHDVSVLERAAQLASPLGCRLRNAVVRRVPERARRPGFEAILRHEL